MIGRMMGGLRCRLTNMARAREEAKVEDMCPGWEQIVATPMFQSWLYGQSSELRGLAESYEADDAIRLLQTFQACWERRFGRHTLH